LGALGPLRESFVGLARREIAADEPFHVVLQFGGGNLQTSYLPPQIRVGGESAPEVDLEALDLVAVRVRYELPLQTDVGGLRSGAGVGAAVQSDADRVRHSVLYVGKSLFQRLNHAECAL